MLLPFGVINDDDDNNSACVKEICEIFAFIGGGKFGDGLLNAANGIFPRPTPVAMATKFETNMAITRLV